MPSLPESVALGVLGVIGGIVALHDPNSTLLQLICVGIVGALKISPLSSPQPKDPV